MTFWATSVGAAGQPGLGFSTLPSDVVLSLSYHHDLLAENDPTPMIRIYGDGRVLIHYPAYMTLAGDYETRMTTGELRQLLLGMADRRVLDFDGQAVAQAKRQEQGRRAALGYLFEISDETHTVIQVNLNWYRPTGSGAQINNLRKTIRWGNLPEEAGLFPGIRDLQELADTEEELRSLLERDDLRRLP